MPGRRTLLALLVLAAALCASDRTVLDETALEIQSALRAADYTAVSKAFRRAQALRNGYADQEFETVVKAVATGIKHRDRSIVLLSIKTLGTLHVRGSSRYLVRLLSPPRQPASESLQLHLAAIEAVSRINDKAVVGKLERLVAHPNTEIAVAGCQALARFKWLARKPRLALTGRLVNALGRLEKKKARKARYKVHLSKVKGALVFALQQLTRTELTASGDYREWLTAARRTDPT